MAQQLANFATGAGVFDAYLYGGAMIDSSPMAGNGDLSLNSVSSSYMKTTTTFTTSATSGSGISFSGWFFPSGTQNVGSTIFDISTATMSVSLFYGTSSTVTGLFNGTDVSSTYTVTPNSWHFFCYTVLCSPASLAIQTLYVDNPSVNVTSQAITPYVVLNQTTAGNNYIGYGIGSANGTVYQYFNGKLDDFRVYNRVLSPPEINVLYNYNYGTNTIAASAVTVSPNYDPPQISSVQIDVSGTFSSLDISRNPAFSGTQVINISSASLTSTNGTLWAYTDLSVIPDTAYSYLITPRVGTVTGTMVTLSSITTTPMIGGNFNSLTTGSLPANNASVTSPAITGFTVSSGGTNTYSLSAGNGGGIYSGSLPSTVTYYLSLTTQPSSTSSFTQYVNISSAGYISFYAWGADSTYSAPYNSSTTISVTLGNVTLLNNFTFTTGSAVPFTSFSLPFSINTLGTYSLVITVLNNGASASTVSFAGVQVRSQAFATIAGYKAIDPSMMQMYYSFDASSGAGYLSNYATGASVLDASLAANATLSSSSPIIPLISSNYLLLDGNSYAGIGSWTCPTYAVGQGFSIACWVYPTASPTTKPATICSLSNNSSGGKVSIYMSNTTNALDISFVGVAGDPDVNISAFPLMLNRWSFITVTCQGIAGTKGQYNYFINDVSLAYNQSSWPNTATPYTFNYVGGVPSSTTIGTNSGPLGNFTGCIEDFRVYNRVLTNQDIFSLWSLGYTNTNYSNLIDPSGLNVYFPFDQGAALV
jgi:hypothetical protein